MPPQPNLQAYERRLRQDARLAKFSSIGLSKLARFALRRSSGKPLLTLEGVLNQVWTGLGFCVSASGQGLPCRRHAGYGRSTFHCGRSRAAISDFQLNLNFRTNPSGSWDGGFVPWH
jgi:hypothetical protein